MRALILTTVVVAATTVGASAAIVADSSFSSGLTASNNIDLSAPVVSPSLVERVNAHPDATWSAAMPAGKHSGISHREFRRLLGVRAETEADKKFRAGFPVREFTAEEKAMDIPDEFDSAKQWPQCATIPHIYDQSRCGSCWAVAGAGAMSDRYCVSGQNNNLFISARDLMSCGWGFGCNGGNPLLAWAYWQNSGLVSEACQPYPFACGNDGTLPPCPSDSYPTPECLANCTSNNGTFTKYYGNSSYVIWGEENYQREIIANGPIEVGLMVFDDFMSYKSGVYTHVTGDFAGGHAVRLVGWGRLNSTKYWKIANSWGTSWGMDGYFLIKRGSNECNIELSGTAGVPRK